MTKKLIEKQAELEVLDELFACLESVRRSTEGDKRSYEYTTNDDGEEVKVVFEEHDWRKDCCARLAAKLVAIDNICSCLEKRI